MKKPQQRRHAGSALRVTQPRWSNAKGRKEGGGRRRRRKGGEEEEKGERKKRLVEDSPTVSALCKEAQVSQSWRVAEGAVKTNRNDESDGGNHLRSTQRALPMGGRKKRASTGRLGGTIAMWQPQDQLKLRQVAHLERDVAHKKWRSMSFLLFFKIVIFCFEQQPQISTKHKRAAVASWQGAVMVAPFSLVVRCCWREKAASSPATLSWSLAKSHGKGNESASNLSWAKSCGKGNENFASALF